MWLTKSNPVVSVAAAMVMLGSAIAICSIAISRHQTLSRNAYATVVLLFIFGAGILLRELWRKRKL
jgi:hypothetical protein